jgi:hypothetical protein
MRTSRAMSLPALPVFGDRDAGRLPDLVGFLDSDPRPTFLVPIEPGAVIQFELLLWYEAFLNAHTRDDVLAQKNPPKQFRSWCQTVVHWREDYDFAGRTWTAFRVQKRWKCIQTSKAVSRVFMPAVDKHPDSLREDEIRMLQDQVNADARLASLYRMMEMSDVGTFEYNPQGTLLRANVSITIPATTRHMLTICPGIVV